MITAKLDKNWRDDCFGKLDFDKLEYFLMMAYHVCKDVDSSDWFGHWPDQIRFHIAEAYSLIQEWNKINVIKNNAPNESDAKMAFRSYCNYLYKQLHDVVEETNNDDNT